MEEKLFESVEMNQYGFYELKNKYRKVMDEFYEKEYYQNDMGLYKKNEYTEDELKYRNNTNAEKEFIYTKMGGAAGKFIDLGCGEGFVMQYFFNKGWNVKGIDFSDFGIIAHNPKMKDFLLKGDLYKEMEKLNETFSFINCDNVLEHLPDANSFLLILKKLCNDNTVICITVPNDFSITQKKLYEKKCIDDAFWVTTKTSEHFNYFTAESLKNYFEVNDFKMLKMISSWPIDFNLFNKNTNYIKNKAIGHDGYIAKITIENMLFEQSLEKTVQFHESLAQLGVGRDVSLYFKLK